MVLANRRANKEAKILALRAKHAELSDYYAEVCRDVRDKATICEKEAKRTKPKRRAKGGRVKREKTKNEIKLHELKREEASLRGRMNQLECDIWFLGYDGDPLPKLRSRRKPVRKMCPVSYWDYAREETRNDPVEITVSEIESGKIGLLASLIPDRTNSLRRKPYEEIRWGENAWGPMDWWQPDDQPLVEIYPQTGQLKGPSAVEYHDWVFGSSRAYSKPIANVASPSPKDYENVEAGGFYNAIGIALIARFNFDHLFGELKPGEVRRFHFSKTNHFAAAYKCVNVLDLMIQGWESKPIQEYLQITPATYERRKGRIQEPARPFLKELFPNSPHWSAEQAGAEKINDDSPGSAP